MKTPEKWLEIRTSALHDGDGFNADLHKWIAAIQLEAFKEGRSWGIRESADLFNYCQIWKKDFVSKLLLKHSETTTDHLT